MVATDPYWPGRPVVLAARSVTDPSQEFGQGRESSESLMPYACQACAKRKVKCDRVAPPCFNCRKSKLECAYQTTSLRKRKRRLSSAINERLVQYEKILMQHGLLPREMDQASPPEEKTEGSTPDESISLRFIEPETSRIGKLVAAHGKSRYIDSNLWRTLGEDAMHAVSHDDVDDEDEDQVDGLINIAVPSDPLSQALMGSQQSLLQYHPTHAQATLLWKMHIENVEPICKVLHIPSTTRMVDLNSQQPETTSKVDECLLFAIYHFAVFSMTEVECIHALGQPRNTLVEKCHFATRQALVNASFLKTTEISILQALVLFLLPCRHYYDAHTYWILTGVAVRIAQRMGLHRDGEKLDLPPYEVQMRRRIFYQVIPLDGIASQMSATGVALMPETWDTERPSNINDEQIWPGMTEKPKEQKGATEMIFCLARSCVGKYFAMVGKSMNFDEIQLAINEAETEVEEQYIPYCDIVNPLHLLTIALARSAITAMRLRTRLPKIRNNTATEVEKKELLHLSQKIIDTDIAACANASLERYRWHVRPFFAWGSWDSIIFVLTSLSKRGLLTPEEEDIAWDKVEQTYTNHDELLHSHGALQIAVGRLTVKAWDARITDNTVAEPDFITTLRSVRRQDGVHRRTNNLSPMTTDTNTPSTGDASSASDPNAVFASLSGDMNVDLSSDFNLDTTDWMFWDQLIKDYQMQGGQ